MTASSPAPTARHLALLVVLGLALAACAGRGSELDASATTAPGLLSAADEVVGPETPAGDPAATDPSLTLPPGTVEATAVPPTAAPPTLAPVTGPAPTSAKPASTAAAKAPGTTTPVPKARPAMPGVTAQPNDPNDAYNGGGPVSCQIFPSSSPWKRNVSSLPVHPQSSAWVNSLGAGGHLHPDFGTIWEGKAIGIPYVVVSGSQPRVPVSFFYASESDPGPYPIPPNAPIEDGSTDHHLLVVDDTNCKLYELFDATPINGGTSWKAGSGAVFDLRSTALRPTYWTSADAAGLPIFPGLATYDEVVVKHRIDHALRFTANRTSKGFIKPATHYASDTSDPNVPPMGARFRLKAGYDCSPYSAEAQVVCAALKTYGMYLADNGASWMLSGAPDPRWNDRNLFDLNQIPGSAFEAVDTGDPIIH